MKLRSFPEGTLDLFATGFEKQNGIYDKKYDWRNERKLT